MNVTPVTGIDWMAKCAVVLRQLRGHRLLRDRSSGLRRAVERTSPKPSVRLSGSEELIIALVAR